jgi:hypothetical protein
MKMREWTQDEAERILGEMDRQIKKIKASDKTPIPTSAPLNPNPGAVWVDVENGKLKVWTGNKWESFTKD